MLVRLNKFLSSDEMVLKVKEQYTIDDQDFLSNTKLDKNILFSGEIFKVEDSVLLSGKIKYTFKDECARCLKSFNNEVETKFEAMIVKKLSDDESDEIKLLLSDGCIDLEEIIKQMIYLSMPMKTLCSSDCKGICPSCGVNLNVEACKCENITTDPRLEKLRGLLKE